MRRNPPDITITKASGETAGYERDKLRDSLSRSGAAPSAIDKVIDEVESQLRQGMSTRKIYRKAFQVLRRNSVHAASRYKLRQAVMDLGPSGYPFERFVGSLFEARGYKAKTGIMVNGQCVRHELDVIAWKNGTIAIAECKFRNQPGSRTDVKVALYYHARFQDVEATFKSDNGKEWKNAGLLMKHDSDPVFEPWLVTNAKFTEDAIRYSECAGIRLMGWDYPSEGSLLHMIEKTGLIPVTLLEGLSKRDKQLLLDENITICQDLYENHGIMEKIGIEHKRRNRTMQELEAVMD